MSIFSGVEPPAWLQESTRPADIGAMGQVLGTATAGGFLAASEGKPWSQGVAEAREDQNDPAWRLKQEQVRVQVLGTAARAESEWQNLQFQKQDTAAWMNEDLPALSQYAKDRMANPNTPLPIAKSVQGQKVTQQLEMTRIREMTAENQSTGAKISTKTSNEFLRQLDDVVKDDPSASSLINMRDKYGMFTPQAWSELTAKQEAVQQKKETSATAAAAAATASGQQATTTITQGRRGPQVTTKWSAPHAYAPEVLANAIEDAQSKQNQAIADGDDEMAQKYGDRAKFLQRQGKDGDLSEPKEIKLSNGQTAVWVPGSKGLQILKDPKKEAEGKVAYAKFSSALVALRNAKERGMSDADGLLALKQDVATAEKQFRNFWTETNQKPAPAPADSAGATKPKVLSITPAQ